ncbi:uncharacterized protein SPPG_01875 [Spizellomyces punctatus DAOM BR117]|uniref:Uncharacterized protein n=1 Tax=Spizellomyces punctatus (strain DAOM BR117) TaxID=645134 RepID=A0A0L0HPR5_SPIPD|nr:uncharacterized protein SPPG_01875 [Spizellomyces punctatus DAOM BR117]KND02794.1 hypothetical protein SPPG_01875 [Spizellomyces punctatus DAOM BR117]|eukprot:XP_016610833.1 hypothetical protein SPPG_01875 [Spizellomyces punctatus DAOM BR117]
MEAFANEAPGMTFRSWERDDFEDIYEDIPFLRRHCIIPLPSTDDCLLLLDESGRFLMYILDMSVVYLVGNNLEEGWRRFLEGSQGRWSLVLNRMDSDTGCLLNDAAGMNVGITTLVLTPSHYPTDAEVMAHVAESIQEMPFVSEKTIATQKACALLESVNLRDYVTISLAVSNTGLVEISGLWKKTNDEEQVQKLLQTYGQNRLGLVGLE